MSDLIHGLIGGFVFIGACLFFRWLFGLGYEERSDSDSDSDEKFDTRLEARCKKLDLKIRKLQEEQRIALKKLESEQRKRCKND